MKLSKTTSTRKKCKCLEMRTHTSFHNIFWVSVITKNQTAKFWSKLITARNLRLVNLKYKMLINLLESGAWCVIEWFLNYFRKTSQVEQYSSTAVTYLFFLNSYCLVLDWENSTKAFYWSIVYICIIAYNQCLWFWHVNDPKCGSCHIFNVRYDKLFF